MSGIYVIPHFFTPEECSRLIRETEAAGFEAATIQTRKGSVEDPAVRNNQRVIADDPDRARELWLRLKSHLPVFLQGRQAVGLNERFRFYRYVPGQFFAPHADGPFRRQNGEESRLTVLIYLNDDFEGGETAFAETVISPRTGLAVAFLHELIHEGRPVRSGTKYVLRSDVMFNPVGRISG